jgi:hypothetical protein
MTNPKYTSKSETERVFDVFATFNKDAKNIQSPLNIDTETSSQSVLTMSSLGQLGRFGNQLFQYAFLRICAHKTGALVECPLLPDINSFPGPLQGLYSLTISTCE